MAALPQARCRFTLDSSIWLNLVQVWIQMMDRDRVVRCDMGEAAPGHPAGRPPRHLDRSRHRHGSRLGRPG